MDETFGQRLRQARTAAGLTLRDLADRCGVDFTYISHIEHGRNLPSAATARAFGVALGVDLRRAKDAEDELIDVAYRYVQARYDAFEHAREGTPAGYRARAEQVQRLVEHMLEKVLQLPPGRHPNDQAKV